MRATIYPKKLTRNMIIAAKDAKRPGDRFLMLCQKLFTVRPISINYTSNYPYD